MYAAFCLMGTLLGVAGLFVLANAEFLAVTQVMVYVGGVLVLIIFGLMLTGRGADGPLMTKDHFRFWSFLAGLGVLSLLIFAVQRLGAKEILSQPEVNVKMLGLALMTDSVLGLELAAIILMVALAGAAFIASVEPSDPKGKL